MRTTGINNLLFKMCYLLVIDLDILCFGSPFQMDIDEGMSQVLYSKLLELEKEVRRKLSERNADKEANGQ